MIMLNMMIVAHTNYMLETKDREESDRVLLWSWSF